MPVGTGTAIMIAKFVGSVFGAFMALVIMPPKTIRAALSRIGVSLPSGFFLANPASELLKLNASWENLAAGAVVSGVFGWVLLSSVWRLIQNATWENISKIFRK